MRRVCSRSGGIFWRSTAGGCGVQGGGDGIGGAAGLCGDDGGEWAKDPLFLQIKEETESGYAPYVAKARGAQHHGKRVVYGERAMQLQSDPFLGWTTLNGRDYLVRQLNDHKASIQLESLRAAGLLDYAAVCGEMLARGHARAGDSSMISGYLGRSTRFDPGCGGVCGDVCRPDGGGLEAVGAVLEEDGEHEEEGRYEKGLGVATICDAESVEFCSLLDILPIRDYMCRTSRSNMREIKKADLLQGTLDMLILKVVALGSIHGYGISQRIQQISKDVLQVQQGSLYPALHRLRSAGGLRRTGESRRTGGRRSFIVCPQWDADNWRQRRRVGIASRRRLR